MSALGLAHLGGGPGGGHLGARLDALVDGQLPHDERDRVLAHIARCPDCYDALLAARAMKAALRRLAEADVPGDLTSRLLAVAVQDDPLTPPRSHLGAHPDGAHSDFPSRARRRGAGTLSVVGLAVGAALLASAPGAPEGVTGPAKGGPERPGGARVNAPGVGGETTDARLVSVPRTPPGAATTGRGRTYEPGRAPYLPLVARDGVASPFAPMSVRVVRATPSPFRPRMLASRVPLHAR